MNFQEISRIFRLGFDQAALEDGASAGQVPRLGAGGQMEFGDAGGGSQTQSVTVTTDPNTFTVEHVFDFAGPATAFVTLTITEIVLDGETFAADGVRPLWEDGGGNSAVISPDGVDYTSSASSGVLYTAGKGNSGSADAAFQVGDVGYQGWATPRYLKVPVSIFQADGATLYNGPHHPTVTVRIDVVYVAGGQFGGGGSQSLVDLGIVNFVDLLTGPQTLYAPAVGEFVQITIDSADYVAADGQLTLEASDDPTITTDLVAPSGQSFSAVRSLISPGIVRSGTAITAALYQNVSSLIVPSLSPAWQANHVYAAGALVTGPDDHLWSSSGGTSAGGIPDFAGNEGATVIDNTVTWQDEGAIPTRGAIHLYAVVVAA